MPPATGKMTIFVSAACAGAAQRLPRLLPPLRVRAELLTVPPAELSALLAERPADAVILGPGQFELAADLSEHSYTGVLLLAEGEALRDLAAACAASGVLLADAQSLDAALPQLLALCSRLRLLRARTVVLRQKLDDTRLISRAKLLLMSRFKMSEGEAHRYIEKTAMDGGTKRREVAERIIRTYEE